MGRGRSYPYLRVTPGWAKRGATGPDAPLPFRWSRGATPTPPFPLQTLMGTAPVRGVVEAPPREPHAGRLRDHGPRPQRGPRARRHGRPGAGRPRPPDVRRQGEARGAREVPRGPGGRRRRPVQRRAPSLPALPPREGPEARVLRPAPAHPRDLRGAGPRAGGEAPGRARPPPLRGADPPGVDSQRRGRRAAGVHGGGRVPRRRVPGDREAADAPDRGGPRGRAAGAGPPAGRAEGPRVPPRLPRRVRERGEELDAQRAHRRAGPRGGADVLDTLHDDPGPPGPATGPPHGHGRVRRPGPVLDGRGVQLDVRGDLRERPHPPPRRRLGRRDRDPAEGPPRRPDPPAAGGGGRDPARPHEGGPRVPGPARGDRAAPRGLGVPRAPGRHLHGDGAGAPRAPRRDRRAVRVPPRARPPPPRGPGGGGRDGLAVRERRGPPGGLRPAVHRGPLPVPRGRRGADRCDGEDRVPGERRRDVNTGEAGPELPLSKVNRDAPLAPP